MTNPSKRRFPAIHAFWARVLTRLGRSRSESTPRPAAEPAPQEIGGPKGPEPTRYGDWENKGRAIDF
jgi:hypothetical protein